MAIVKRKPTSPGRRHVVNIVSEGLHDQAFCDRHVLGFDEATLPEGAPAGSSYRAYLMGEADGIAKTPEWAEPITGSPAETIRRLAPAVGSPCRV